MFNALRSKAVKVVALASALSLTAITSAQAALPTGVATMFTGITADFNDLIDTYTWPLLIVVMTSFIILKLFKKAAVKAT